MNFMNCSCYLCMNLFACTINKKNCTVTVVHHTVAYPMINISREQWLSM